MANQPNLNFHGRWWYKFGINYSPLLLFHSCDIEGLTIIFWKIRLSWGFEISFVERNAVLKGESE